MGLRRRGRDGRGWSSPCAWPSASVTGDKGQARPDAPRSTSHLKHIAGVGLRVASCLLTSWGRCRTATFRLRPSKLCPSWPSGRWQSPPRLVLASIHARSTTTSARPLVSWASEAFPASCLPLLWASHAPSAPTFFSPLKAGEPLSN